MLWQGIGGARRDEIRRPERGGRSKATTWGELRQDGMPSRKKVDPGTKKETRALCTPGPSYSTRCEYSQNLFFKEYRFSGRMSNRCESIFTHPQYPEKLPVRMREDICDGESPHRMERSNSAFVHDSRALFDCRGPACPQLHLCVARFLHEPCPEGWKATLRLCSFC